MSDIRLRCDITHEEQAEFLQIMGTKKKSYQELLGHFIRTTISVNKTFKECETKKQLKLNFPDSNELITFTTPNIKTEKMEKEVISKHPEHRESIELFVRHMKNSINMATVLIALITIFGGILMYYRHGIE